jgi:hypothetical protein
MLNLILLNHDYDASPAWARATTTGFSALNLVAPAYIKSVYDLGSGSKQPTFNLNVEIGPELPSQLSSGRDNVSTNEYWVAYIQGAFQGGSAKDSDPDNEPVTGGLTATFLNNPPSSLDQGSLVYVESLRDFGACPGITTLSKTTVHEVGHQFGLLDSTGGIMNQGCIPATDLYFVPDHVAAMRGRTHP